MTTKDELINAIQSLTDTYSLRELQRSKKADLEKVLHHEKQKNADDVDEWIKSENDAIQEQATEVVDENKQAPIIQKVESKVRNEDKAKTVTAKVDATMQIQKPAEFFDRADTLVTEYNRQKHLVRYLGVERYWTNQQIEICLKDTTVTLVLDGSVKDIYNGRYLELPKNTQFVSKSKERRPCVGCGR